MKLWDKGYDLDKKIEAFTVNDDHILDMKLIRYDIEASFAHANMLREIKILSEEEFSNISKGLNEILKLLDEGKFEIKISQEDCHTAIEEFLTDFIGDAGKKIHTGRSRNDQVLTAIRLYEKHEIMLVSNLINDFNNNIYTIIKSNNDIILSGYTHTRKAMPLSLESWLGGFRNAMKDNLISLSSDFDIADNNPLGSAAGFGVPVIRINRETTSKYLGFKKWYDTDSYYQNTRGKIEGMIISTLSSIMLDLNKLCSDLIFYSMDEFKCLKLPDTICTGSSIMPHKKNPDVLELVRANYHIILSEEIRVKTISANLISGYHRDLQLTKASLINSFEITKNSIEIMSYVLSKIEFNKENIESQLTPELYAVEKVNKLLNSGVTFRDAYNEISKQFLIR
ncbi:MAG: argininosuccinate lyase [Bacteroidetes bacterium]|nr:argininosuccinate lyase [Bacteroidota bacterium]